MKKHLLPLFMLMAFGAMAQKNIAIRVTNPTNGQLIYELESLPIKYMVTNLGAPLTNQDTIYASLEYDGTILYAPGFPLQPAKWAFVPFRTITSNDSVEVTMMRSFLFSDDKKKLNVPFCITAALKGDTGLTESNNTSCIFMNVNVPTSLSKNYTAAVSLKVYPNPAKEVLNFFIDYDKALKVTLLDITGKQLEVSPFWLKQTSINLSNYHSGVYMYQISGENGEIIKTGKFTVN